MSIGPKSWKGGRFFTSWLPCQLDLRLQGGKVFYIVITMSMGKTRFWGWWFFYMVITMSIGQKTGNREGFLHGDYHVNGQNTVLRFFTWWLPCQLDPCQPKSPIGWPLKKKISRNPWFRSELRNHDNHGIMNPKTKISCWYDGKMPMVSVLAAKPKVVQHARPLRGSADKV